MAIVYLGIDLAKSVFALHGVDESGRAALIRPSVARSKLEEVVAALPPCVIGMEACSGAHHWARLFLAHGHTVRLIAPKFVVPYRLSGKPGKNDAADAAAEDQLLELSLDVPDVSREQLSIGIEGNVIRIETLPEAKRQHKAAYESAEHTAAQQQAQTDWLIASSGQRGFTSKV